MSEALYREAFAAVGHRLTKRDATPERSIIAAEKRLGCSVPESLRAFYRLAGNARRVLDHYDHFLLPSDWSCEGGKLVFLAENQGVVLYAINSASRKADPPVLMSNGDDTGKWFRVAGSCSEFLRVMVHWEGAFGGAMPVGRSAVVPKGFRRKLEAGFRVAGEVNAMRAYGKPGLAVCFVRWNDEWRIFVGATEEARMAEVEKLGARLQAGA